MGLRLGILASLCVFDKSPMGLQSDILVSNRSPMGLRRVSDRFPMIIIFS